MYTLRHSTNKRSATLAPARLSLQAENADEGADIIREFVPADHTRTEARRLPPLND